jgi:sugar/nucleoside kinase (ribokinase family)
LIYGWDGLHDEKSVYGQEMDELINRIDVITARQIAEHCDEATKGIYVEASEKDELWEDLGEIRSKCGAKIMWELPTSAAMDEARKPGVFETIKSAGLYSVNLPEALSLFGAADEEGAVKAIAEFGVPCFFRVGKKGSYMIDERGAVFGKSIDVGKLVDTTGCGNASTAAALYAYCEGFELRKIVAAANLSAAYNLLQYGPYPAFTPEIRSEAQKRLDSELSGR